MRDLSSIDFKDNVRFVVRRELKSLGLKVPKNKPNTKLAIECNGEGVFGIPLDKVPTRNVGEDFYCGVPKFLVDSCSFLRKHLGTEGLFRKSGSVQRQKILKQKIEVGEDISTAHPHDVASLIKQFFRHLQEPLLTNLYHDSFVKSLRNENENERTAIILFICLMLPLTHLQTLQYTMKFAAEVATYSEQSKMGLSNLAIVLTPNLMHNSKKDNSNSSEKLLKDQTEIIEILLKNANHIGMVPEDIYETAKMIGDDADYAMTSSGDELDTENIQRYKSKRAPRARTRTGSITDPLTQTISPPIRASQFSQRNMSGFIGHSLNKLKTNSTNSSKNAPVNRHRRTKSVKADLMRNKYRYTEAHDIIISKDDGELDMFSAHADERMSMRIPSNKRRVEYNNAAMSPAMKRRARIAQESKNGADNGIGHPKIVSRSTQMFTTTIKPLTPVRPLTDMVKKEHAKVLLSEETEHVKVIDAMTYIPSPDKTQHENERYAHPSRTGSNTHLLGDESFESPVSGGAAVHSKRRGKGDEMQRRRITRRHSSGATSCFNSSPRQRKGNVHKQESNVGAINKTPDRDLDLVNVAVKNSMSGVNKYQNAKFSSTGDRMTPCKHHIATPPMVANIEMKTLLSQRI